MNTNKQVLKLPRELKDLEKIQNSHHSAVSQNMMVQWRDFLIGEIQDKLRKNNHNFFEASNEAYEASPLKRIISRFDFILNTYLREFVQISINDFVKFIENFTTPMDKPEAPIWKTNREPFVIIHLAIHKKDKKKKGAEKKKTDKKVKDKEDESEHAEEGEEQDDQNRVIFKPSMQECRQFVLNSMDMMIKSTNQINDLESDLMPFLQKLGFPNFKIDKDFSWIKEALEKLNFMLDNNVGGPNALLEEYKKYEYILNVDKKALIDDLFKCGENKDEKKPLEEIEAQIQHYAQAYYEIMTLKEDEVNFNIFKVVVKRLKQDLGEQAIKIQERIMDATYQYANDTVAEINSTYMMMQQKICHEPKNEVELIETRDFISGAIAMDADLLAKLKVVGQHHEMLEKFSYMYKEKDIDIFFNMRIWTLRIQAFLGDAKTMMTDKQEIFSTNLEREKEQFQVQLDQYKENLNKIKTYSNENQSLEYSNDAYTLNENINHSYEMKKQFNEREKIFNLPETLYQDLDDLRVQFKPFFDLTTISQTVKTEINDWLNNSLMKIESEHIAGQVATWHQNCFKLKKDLAEEYPDASDVAQVVKQKIEDFMRYLPLIRCFTSNAIFEEEWKEIQEVVLKSDKLPAENTFEREDIKIQDIESFNLLEFVEDIDDIAMKAEKKFTLQQNIKKMKDELKQFQLELQDYKGVSFLVRGWDDINSTLDD